MARLYVTVARGEPGQEVVPLLVSADPAVVRAVLDLVTRMALDPEPPPPEAAA